MCLAVRNLPNFHNFVADACTDVVSMDVRNAIDTRITHHSRITFLLLLLDCVNTLGMENDQVRDHQITSSRHYDNLVRARNARLNLKTIWDVRKGAWAPPTLDLNQWLQVNFERPAFITAISTQGRQDNDQHVTSYTISFSNDGQNFHGYKAGGVLEVR